MKTAIFAILAAATTLMASEPSRPPKTDYKSLSTESLIMRFRFPGRYMDTGAEIDPAPRDAALKEMIQRKLIKEDSTLSDITFLLGKPEHNKQTISSDGKQFWNYKLMSGTLEIAFNSKKKVAHVLVNRDGEPDHAHTQDLLKEYRETEQGAAANP